MLSLRENTIYFGKAMPSSGGGGTSIVKIVNALPDVGDDEHLYGLLMDVQDRENRGIVQFFVWDTANSEWLATACAYSIDIDTSSILLKSDITIDENNIVTIDLGDTPTPPTPPTPTPSFDENTLACWHFDTDAVDAVGGTKSIVGIDTFSDTEDTYKFTKSGIFTVGQSEKNTPYALSSGIVLGNTFTIDFWANFSENTALRFAQDTVPNNCVFLATDGNCGIISNGSPIQITDSSGLTSNTRTHCAFVCDNKVFKIFINGVLKRTQDMSSYWNGITLNYIIARNFVRAGGTIYVDELRISNTARWATDFTPPSAPYPAGQE